jgi:hypothetical protein
MNAMRFRLRTLLLLLAAVPIWAYLIVIVPQGTGFGGGAWRFVVAPFVLSGIALACFWPLRRFRDGAALSVLLSPVVALGSVLIAQALSD